MDSLALHNAQDYAHRRGLTIRDQLGSGVDGVVLSTDQHTAIKALRHQHSYARERDVYIRLQEHQVVQVTDFFNVPELVGYHDELQVVEMEIVSPPFVLDFAGAYLDEKPDFPPEIIEAWHAEKQEQFGADWAKVKVAIFAFEKYGVYLSDVKPGNVSV